MNMTLTKINAIDSFIKGEKASGRWGLIGRLYLPIWEVAGANAICMKSFTRLTFNGGITHGFGFIQGNGSTGYVDTNTTPSSIGLTKDSYYGGFLRLGVSPVDSIDFGVGATLGNPGQFFYANDWYYDSDLEVDVFAAEFFNVSNRFIAQVQSPSILLSVGGITSSRFIKDRRSFGVVARATNTTTNTSNIADNSIYLMASNVNNTPFQRSSSQYGAFFFGTAMSGAQDTAFTLALKNLWETTTELTIP